VQRETKKQFVKSINQTLENVSVVLITHYHGLSVGKLTALRTEMREAGASFKVMKNSLAKIAIKDTEFESLNDMFTGPVGVVFATDAVALAKTLTKFSKENKELKIIGGMVDKSVVDEDTIKQLSTLPSLDELRAKMIGLINGPAAKLVGLLCAPAGQIARVLKANSEK
jgi:large subunit ribosomal protein L10